MSCVICQAVLELPYTREALGLHLPASWRLEESVNEECEFKLRNGVYVCGDGGTHILMSDGGLSCHLCCLLRLGTEIR